jgi:glycosyltransferase involved in cell wall biosynthesis
MAHCLYCGKTHNIGFVSTRLAGTDGVSLETAKWGAFFEKLGFNCFYFAGRLDRPRKRSYRVNAADFRHPDIRRIYRNSFGTLTRPRLTTQKIYEIKRKLKDHLYDFIDKFNIHLLVPENVLAMPLNLPLGIALTEVISETGMPAIAHHHDFYWERQHFLVNAAWEYINMAFPPHLPSMKHVVINSSASNQLSLRTGISATIIPIVLDFVNPPPAVDDYASDVRAALGIRTDELLILQPKRVVKRKGIEHAIELVHRLGRKAKLIISYESDDEEHDYELHIHDYSKRMNVDAAFVSKIIGNHRRYRKDGSKIYTLEDVYPHADLVTYPSNFEGFGSAFLEAVYFRKPMVVNTYSIYTLDVKPKGFSVIEIDGYVGDRSVRETRSILENTKGCRKMVDHNYNLASRYIPMPCLIKN